MMADLDLIATTTASSGSVTDITFSSIGSGYTDLMILGQLRSTAAANLSSLYLQVNGDTATNYSEQYLYVDQANTYASASGSGAAYTIAGYFAGGNLAANNMSGVYLYIAQYGNTTNFKQIETRSGIADSTVGLQYTRFNASLWRSSAAITSLKLYPASGSFAQYSTLSLYGIARKV